MKKNVIALAIASAIAAPVAMADAPTVYGQVNMAVSQTSVDSNTAANEDKDGASVDSRASRLGVKGSEDLGNGLKAVYKFEFEVQIDKGDTLKNRNQYVGLAGGFGTVLMGRHDTPLKMSQVKDFFNDGPSDLKYASVTADTDLKGGEQRISNVLAYVSPSFGGVKLVAALQPGEGGTTDSDGDTNESGIADTYSVAAMYGSTKKGLYLAAAYNNHVNDDYDVNGTDVNLDNPTITRLSAGYATGGLNVNGMYQVEETGDINGGDDNKATTVMAQAAYKMGNIMPKIKYATSEWDEETAAMDTQSLLAIGLDYSFGKKTTGYVEYADVQNVYGVKDEDKNVISVGLLHKF